MLRKIYIYATNNFSWPYLFLTGVVHLQELYDFPNKECIAWLYPFLYLPHPPPSLPHPPHTKGGIQNSKPVLAFSPRKYIKEIIDEPETTYPRKLILPELLKCFKLSNLTLGTYTEQLDK